MRTYGQLTFAFCFTKFNAKDGLTREMHLTGGHVSDKFSEVQISIFKFSMSKKRLLKLSIFYSDNIHFKKAQQDYEKYN